MSKYLVWVACSHSKDEQVTFEGGERDVDCVLASGRGCKNGWKVWSFCLS